MTDYTPDPQNFRALLDIPKHRDACPLGLDAHTYSAAQTFGVAYDEVTPEQRAFTKELSFGAQSTTEIDYATCELRVLAQLAAGLVHDSVSPRPDTLIMSTAWHQHLVEMFGLMRRRRPRRIDKKFAQRGWQQHYARR